MTEYDVLKMSDEEYLNYCKKNCIREKLKIFIFLLLEFLFALLTIFLYSSESYFLIPFSAYLCGALSVFATFSGIELRRWKHEVIFRDTYGNEL